MPPIHIALRYGRSVAGGEDTIAAHQAVLASEGAVLFGKLGRPFGRQTIDKINAQVSDRTATYLFLVARIGQELRVHRGRVTGMWKQAPSDAEALIPSYYSGLGLIEQIGSWFQLSDLRSDNLATAQKLEIAATGTPLLSVLSTSRNSMFLVSAKRGTRL